MSGSLVDIYISHEEPFHFFPGGQQTFEVLSVEGLHFKPKSHSKLSLQRSPSIKTQFVPFQCFPSVQQAFP